ncbi:hypothetical protein HK103_005934 [Boothiomyces macroporosus]|uniref:Velvet domain-containing protein n=1 Tax=Boothiomyces macroporosus TaxID=261099 RepID=A0AAD5YAP1_9FUNG|nr:hypothetical protein HK103_005934 [Boothiomyces macroporosus]
MEGGNGDPLLPRKVTQKASIMTEPFEVYSSKSFPAPAAATLLSRSFAEQGLKLKLRKQHRNGAKKDNESSDDESFSGGKKAKKTKKSEVAKVSGKSAYVQSPSYTARPPSYETYSQPGYRPPPGYYPNYPPYPYDSTGKSNYPPRNVRPDQIPPRPMPYLEREGSYARSFDSKDIKTQYEEKPQTAGYPEVHADEGPLAVLQKAAEYHSSQRVNISNSSVSEDFKNDYNYQPKPISDSPHSKGSGEQKIDQDGMVRHDNSPSKELDPSTQTVKKRRLEVRPRDITRDYALPSIDGKSNVLPPIATPADSEAPEPRNPPRNDEHSLHSGYEKRGSPPQLLSHPSAPYPPPAYYRPPPQYYYPYPPYGYPPHYPPKEGQQDYYRPPYPVRPRPPHDMHYPPPYPHHAPYYPPPGAYPPYYPRPPHREPDNVGDRGDAHRPPYPPSGNPPLPSHPGDYDRQPPPLEKKQWPWVKEEQ